DFFDKEDAHVVELLGGMITTAISDSSEFEAKQTLQSERSAMLEVIERITPTITRMLEQRSVASVQNSSRAAEPEDLAESLPHSDINEELAHSADVALDDEIYADEPLLAADELSTAETVLAAPAAEAPSAPRGDALVGEEDEIAVPFSEPEGEESAASGAAQPVPSNDREKRAVDSAIEILLSNDHVLEPEPPEAEE